MAAFLLLGLGFATAGVTRAVFSDDEHPACQRHADLKKETLLEFAEPARARADLEAELKRDPDADCAANGLALLSQRSCKAADKLLRRRLFTHAEKVYAAEVERDPALRCARAGLRSAAEERCKVARQFVRRDRTQEASAVLKSDTLPDAVATCPGVLPRTPPAPPAPPATQGGDD